MCEGMINGSRKVLCRHLLYPLILQDVIIALKLISSTSPENLFKEWETSGLTELDKRSHFFFTQYLKHHAFTEYHFEETSLSGEGEEESEHFSPFKGAGWTQFIHILMDLYLANVANSLNYSEDEISCVWQGTKLSDSAQTPAFWNCALKVDHYRYSKNGQQKVHYPFSLQAVVHTYFKLNVKNFKEPQDLIIDKSWNLGTRAVLKRCETKAAAKTEDSIASYSNSSSDSGSDSSDSGSESSNLGKNFVLNDVRVPEPKPKSGRADTSTDKKQTKRASKPNSSYDEPSVSKPKSTSALLKKRKSNPSSQQQRLCKISRKSVSETIVDVKIQIPETFRTDTTFDNTTKSGNGDKGSSAISSDLPNVDENNVTASENDEGTRDIKYESLYPPSECKDFIVALRKSLNPLTGNDDITQLEGSLITYEILEQEFRTTKISDLEDATVNATVNMNTCGITYTFSKEISCEKTQTKYIEPKHLPLQVPHKMRILIAPVLHSFPNTGARCFLIAIVQYLCSSSPLGELLDTIFLALQKKESIAVSNDSKKSVAQVLVHLSSIKQHVRKPSLSPSDHITPLEDSLSALTQAVGLNQSMSDDPFTFMSSLIDINPTIEHMFHHHTVVVPPSNLKEIDDKYPLKNDDVIKDLYNSQVGKDGRNRRKMVRTKPHLKSIESFKTFQYDMTQKERNEKYSRPENISPVHQYLKSEITSSNGQPGQNSPHCISMFLNTMLVHKPNLSGTDGATAKEPNVHILPRFFSNGYWYSLRAFISFCYYDEEGRIPHYISYVKASQRVLFEHSGMDNICLRAMDTWFKIDDDEVKTHTFPLHNIKLKDARYEQVPPSWMIRAGEGVRMILFERECFSLNDPEIPTEQEIANANTFITKSKDSPKKNPLSSLSIPFLKNHRMNHKSVGTLHGSAYINDEIVQIVTDSMTHRHSIPAPYKRILFAPRFAGQLCGVCTAKTAPYGKEANTGKDTYKLFLWEQSAKRLIPNVQNNVMSSSSCYRMLCKTLSKNSGTPIPPAPDTDTDATTPLPPNVLDIVTQNDIASFIIPININNMHWSFVSVDFTDQTVTLYDSLSGECKPPGDGQEHDGVRYLNVKYISDVIEHLYSYESPLPFCKDKFAELLEAKDGGTRLQNLCSMYNCFVDEKDSVSKEIPMSTGLITHMMNRLSSILNIAVIWEWIIIDWNCKTVTQQLVKFNNTKKSAADIKASVKFLWDHAVQREKDLYGTNQARKDKTKQCNESDLFSWKLCVSKEMPQQAPGKNNCSLFTLAGIDAMMSGLPVKHIDAASIDANGRTRLANFIRSQVLEVTQMEK